MLKRIDKICLHCSNTYLGTKNTKYCGYKCAKDARKIIIHKNCLYCNKEITVQNWNKDTKYCSMSCKGKDDSAKILNLTCTFCKKEFKRKDLKKYKNKKGNFFCSKPCADKFNVGSNHYEWKEHLHDKNEKLALKQWALKVKERDNYICQLCSEDSDRKLMEAHHMKHRSQFPELQFDFSNGVTLCLKCHALQHINDPKALRLITHKINKYYGKYN